MQAILDATRRTIPVVAIVPEADGVRVGTEVWVEGVKMGRVTDVGLIQGQDTVLVALDLRLHRPARALVTRSSDVRASRRRFIAEPLVRVFAGSPTDPPLQANDTLRGLPRPDPAELLARAQALGPTMDTVLAAARQVRGTLARQETAARELGRQIEATTATAAALWVQMDAGPLGRFMDTGTGPPAHIRSLRGRLAALGQAADRLAGQYAPDGPLALEARDLAARIRSVDAALTLLEERVEGDQGFLGRVQMDPALELAIQGVQVQIDSLLAEAHSIILRMFVP